MRLDHIGRIRGNISINTKIKSANILDGAYRSVHKGKSLNFEELREYNIGDSVKDIDWTFGKTKDHYEWLHFEH